MYVEDELNKFGKYLRQQSRSNLSKAKKRHTGKLYDSMSYYTKQSKNSFQFTFSMEEYGDYVDKGVQGKNSSAKAPNSPYRFGTGTGKKGGLSSGIDGWVRSKRIQFRQPNGRFMSYEQTRYIITRSIYLTGLKTTNFFTNAFNNGFKRLPDDIIKAYGLDVDTLLKISK